MADEVVLLGSGDLYLGYVDDVANATEETISNTLKKVGEIQGGATLIYKPNFTDVKGGARNNVIASFLTSEEVTFKSGLLTWDIENIEKLAAAVLSEDATKGTRRIGVGGIGKVPVNYLRFIHTKVSDGKTITVNIFKAVNQSGFELTFDPEKESVIDAEFKALAVTGKTDGNLVEIVEEVGTILVPTVTSIDPIAIQQLLLPDTLTVNGTNFDNSSVIILELNSVQTQLVTTFVSATEVTAQLPSGTAKGDYTVKVKTGLEISATGQTLTIN